MRCRAIQKRLSAYQDGELSEGEKEAVTLHLLACGACRTKYSELERVWQALGEMKEIQPVPGFYRKLLQKINEPRIDRGLPVFQWVFNLSPSSIVACVLLIAGILMGAYLGKSLGRDDLSPLTHTRPDYSRENIYTASWRAFDPIPPNTLADGYMRMVSFQEKGFK